MYKRSFHSVVQAAFIILVIFLLFYLGHSQATAQATTHYVAPDGNCGGATPCYATIQAAIDAAAAEDEIKIATGTYTGINNQGGLAQVVYINKSITLCGGYTTADWNSSDPVTNPTTLDAQELGRVIAVSGPAEVNITGLRLTGGDATGLFGMDDSNYYGGGLFIRDADVVIDACTIYNNTASNENFHYGYGGGLFQWDGSLTISNSTVEDNVASPIHHAYGGGISLFQTDQAKLVDNQIQDNIACSNPDMDFGYGGGIHIDESTVELTGNTIVNNTAATGSGSTSYGHGGGLYTWDSDVTLSKNTISNNTGSVQRDGYGGGIEINRGTANLIDNLINENIASSTNNPSYDGTGGGVNIWDCELTLTGNHIQDNVAANDKGAGTGGGFHMWDGTATLSGNIVTGNQASANNNGTGGGIVIQDVNFTMVNNVVAANAASHAGSGMYLTGHLGYSTDGHLIHNTFASNTGSGEGIYIENPNPSTTITMTLAFTNTIIADHVTAGIVNMDEDPIISMESTLWFDNGEDFSVDIATTHNYTGDPAFVAPLTGDYHVSATSEALDRGVATEVTIDMDGQSRPNGSAPDLGADEYHRVLTPIFADKAAFDPQWVMLPASNGENKNVLRQRYLLQFRHSNDPGYLTTFIDPLPDTFSFDSELHTPAMTFLQDGGTLTWQTAQLLPPGQVAQVLLTTSSEQVATFDEIINQAEVNAGSLHFDLEATSQVPIFPPLISKPGNGEVCPGDLEVKGAAVPNTVVKIYEDNVEKATTTADETGAFTVTYTTSAGGSSEDVYLTAVSCLQSAPEQCSPPSAQITMKQPLTFVCPQPSTLVNTPTSGSLAGQTLVYPFVNEVGWFVGDDFEFHLIPPHINSYVHLYSRSCEEMGAPANSNESVWLEIIRDDTVIATYNPSSVELPWYHFFIDMELADEPGEIEFNLSCTWASRINNNEQTEMLFSSRGSTDASLVGTVFDITEGPGAGGLEGVSVTAMVYQEDWGGWVPWPAHFYNSQHNPQVTGEDGQFIFFVAPGSYYLEVDGGKTYQSWRSPVIEIGADSLSINIPLTPQTQSADHFVTLQSSGPNPASIVVGIGDTVQWSVWVDPYLSLEEQMDLIDNPSLRSVSTGAFDPLLNKLGFDSGLMIPGNLYQRTFNQAGIYTYSDGAGHTGIINVMGRIFLPIILH